MIKIYKIIKIIFIYFFCINLANSEIKDSLFATVGHKAITQSDIVKEIKIILILSGETFSEEKREQLKSAAIASTMKRSVKEIAIEKYPDLSFNGDDLTLETRKLAGNLGMNVQKLQNTFASVGINFSEVEDQIKTELLWNSLIFKVYKDRININLDEIDEQLTKFKTKKIMYEYLISEIIINHVPEENLESEIDKIKDRIKNEGIKKVAIDISISETAVRGGNLGWVSENTISDSFRGKIEKAGVGNLSEPIFLQNGILFFQIRDRRTIDQKASLEEMKEKLVESEKTKILNMHSLSHYENLKKNLSINYY